IKKLDNVGPKNATRWVFWLVPKGRRKREEFFIDQATIDVLMLLVAELKRRYAVLQLPKVAPERGRFAADRYLFQVDHKAYSQDAINCSIRTLLFKVVLNQGQAVDFSSHALRHAFATELRKLGVDYDIIQQLLHQRDVRTTMY